jgi:hypothetical protein
MPPRSVGRSEASSSAAPVSAWRLVAQLHDVAGPGFGPLVAFEVPVHDVPSAGAESQLDGGGVDDDPIADRDIAGELDQDVGTFGFTRPEPDRDSLQPTGRR